MSTEFINLSEIYLPTAGGSIDGDVEIGGALTVNDGTGAGTTYDLAYEISQLRAENEELKAAWDSVSPVILYNNPSGTSEAITLSESAANFSYIDIVYAKLDSGSGGYNTCRVYDPDGKRASFNQINPVASSNVFQIVFSKLDISGTSITWDARGCTINISAVYGSTGSFSGIGYDEGKQLVYKVVGYR